MSPSFLLTNEIFNKVKKSRFYSLKSSDLVYKEKFYNGVILSTDSEYINWLRLRLGYFENIENNILSLLGQTYKNYEHIIIDGGSTDDTKNIIKQTMEGYGIPGEIHDSEWVDYGTNRTESLQLSYGKCDYRLIIDADDTLEVSKPDELFTGLEADHYKIRIKLGEIAYFRTQLIRSNQNWKYVGVLHEYLEGPKDVELTEGFIEEAEMNAAVSGDTREIKGESKYHNDALIFEKELITKPDLEPGLKSRYQFYLAQSYRDAQMYDRSIEAYEKRAEMGGWHEEVYISLYMIAKMKPKQRS
jgi:glycosyltransferase involved in cell wall biosynthesis